MAWWHSRTTKAFEHFQRAIQEHFGFLETLGYGPPTFSTENGPALGRLYEAEYQRADRKITIGATDSRRLRNVVTVNVWRVPRNTLDDDMEMDVFADKHSPEIAAALSEVQRTDGKTMEAAVAASFPVYAALLAGAARIVITGEHWESGLYHSWV